MRRKHLALQWLLVGVVSYKVALYNIPGQGAWKSCAYFSGILVPDGDEIYSPNRYKNPSRGMDSRVRIVQSFRAPSGIGQSLTLSHRRPSVLPITIRLFLTVHFSFSTEHHVHGSRARRCRFACPFRILADLRLRPPRTQSMGRQEFAFLARFAE